MRYIVAPLILCAILWTSLAFADSNGSAFNSMNLTLTGTVTQQAQFACSFQAKVAGTYSGQVVLPDGVVLGSGVSANITSSATADQSIQFAWPISCTTDGDYVLEVRLGAAVEDSFPKYATRDVVTYYLSVHGGTGTHYDPELPAENFLSSDSVVTYASTGTAHTITVHITGRVYYNTSIEPCFDGGTARGVPDVPVYLDWGSDDSPQTQKWVAGQPGTPTTDMDGNFEYNFTFTNDLYANQIATNGIRVWTKTRNIAAASSVDGTGPFAGWWMVQHATRSVAQMTTTVEISNMNIVADERLGAPLRHFFRARAFYRDQLGDHQLDPVSFHYDSGSSTHFEHIPVTGTTFIVLKSTPAKETGYHEYGHYVDFSHGGIDVILFEPEHNFTTVWHPDAAWTEGWAEFFSAACNDYWHARELTRGAEVENSLTNQLTKSEYDQFLDHQANYQVSTKVSYQDRGECEGTIALILYSVYDSYGTRASGYVGDNDDVHLTGRDIMRAFDEAEEDDADDHEWHDELRLEFLDRLPEPAHASLNALWNYFMHGEALPHAPTPNSTTATIDGSGIGLGWNNTQRPIDLRVTNGSGCPEDFVPKEFRRNAPSSYRVYRQDSDTNWDGTLDNYGDPVAILSPTTFAWHDAVATDRPHSYLVVAFKSGSAGSQYSTPSAEARIVPPAFFSSSLSNNQTVRDVLPITATIEPKSAIAGFSISSNFSSFDVQWGAGANPSTWSEKGITYNVSRTAIAHFQNIASWNTGVVPDGQYTLRIFTHYGSESYETRRLLIVDHKYLEVAPSGKAYTSIQTAINNAEMGDSVLVYSSGPTTTYVGGITMKQTVPLIAVDPGIVLKRTGAGPVVIIDGGFYTRLEGFVVTHEHPLSDPTQYATDNGLKITDANPIIKNCTFKENRATSGAGVYVSGTSSPQFDTCKFVNNVASGDGGGVTIATGVNTSVTFATCTFSGNQAKTLSGSAITMSPVECCTTGSGPVYYFNNCEFSDNGIAVSNVATVHIAEATWGGGIAYFSGCLFARNSDKVLIALDGSNGAELNNCTMVDNACVDRIVKLLGGYATISTSIIAYNDGPLAVTGQTAGIGLSKMILFSNSDQGRGPTDLTWAGTGTQNYMDNPAFRDVANGDYRVYAFSRAAGVANGEKPELHFAATIGACNEIVVPNVTVTVDPGDVNNILGSALLGCPQGEVNGDHMDHLIIAAAFDQNVLTRQLSADELSLQPQYLASGVCSSTKVRGSTSNGYTLTLDHPYLSGYGANDQLTLYLDGYALSQKATFVHRSFDMKSAGAAGDPPGCAGDILCPDGKVGNPDFSWFTTHYPAGNNGATYSEAADYAAPFGAPIGLPDFSKFITHFVGAGHKYPFSGQLLQTIGDVEETASTHIVLQFSEEYVTALDHRLYVDVTLEDCADKNWCVFSLRPNRSDIALSTWLPTDWATSRAPFTPLTIDNGQELCYGVIMTNDTAESTRQLGRLVFQVTGSDPVSISENQFVLTFGELAEAPANSGGQNFIAGDRDPAYAHMSGVSGRQFAPGIQQVFRNSLTQNVPNPFNPQTTLAYSLHNASDVTLTIYNVSGQRIRELVNEHRVPGAYKVVWDGRDGKGAQVASGVYFYKLVAGSFVETKKMVMLK